MRLNENRISVRVFDEDMAEQLIASDVEFMGYVCAGCGRRNCVGVSVFEGKEFEHVACSHVLIVDGKHYRPLCSECVQSFEEPQSTAAKLFGLGDG